MTCASQAQHLRDITTYVTSPPTWHHHLRGITTSPPSIKVALRQMSMRRNPNAHFISQREDETKWQTSSNNTHDAPCTNYNEWLHAIHRTQQQTVGAIQCTMHLALTTMHAIHRKQQQTIGAIQCKMHLALTTMHAIQRTQQHAVGEIQCTMTLH